MSDPDSLDYLQPGFDPRSLTVPRLRSILVAHNVPYTSSAKKSQLVDIFNEQLVPQAKRILSARARAKRTSRGIFDVESSQDSGSSNPFDNHDDHDDHDDHDERHDPLPPSLPPPTSTRRSRSPRKASARIKSEEPDYLQQPLPPRVSSPSKRTSRTSTRQAQVSDTDTGSDLDAPVSTRRTRRSATPHQPPPPPPPQIKTEESDGFFKRTSDAFSSDNPFQSGSSPAPQEWSSGERRRTTAATPRRSTSSRRRTDNYAPTKEYKTPPNPVFIKQEPEPLEVEVGEEFTPEEQLELAAEEASDEEAVVVQSRHPARSSSSGWSTPLSVFLVTLLAVYAGWYRQEKIAVGYCGVGSTISSIPNEIPVPEWAQSVLPSEISVPDSLIEAVEPQCEPCPLHAYCYSDYSVRCEQDYILKPHPFALGGIVPLPPTCEPDGEKVRRVQAVADRAVEELRERTAQYECGGPATEDGAPLDTPFVDENELKAVIDNKRSKKMSNQEFEDLWGSALGEIKAREEVEVVEEIRNPGSVPNTRLSSTSLAGLPVACAVRRSLRLGVARYRLQISAVISALLAFLWARRRIRASRAAAARVPALVDLVLERLVHQKRLGEYGLKSEDGGNGDGDDDDDGGGEDPFLFLPNLRDDVLRSEHSLRERERIWGRVRAVVEQNSNVRTAQREGRSGEVGRAWEWIGALPAGSSDSRRRRRSARPSSSASRDVKREDSSFRPAVKVEGDGPGDLKARTLHRRWEDSRPIF